MSKLLATMEKLGLYYDMMMMKTGYKISKKKTKEFVKINYVFPQLKWSNRFVYVW